MTVKPYYDDGRGIVVYHGDCRDILPSIVADVMVTDPPYGIAWKRGTHRAKGSKPHAGIAGDQDTSLRDWVLDFWLDAPAIVFGSLSLAPPKGLKQTLVWHKPPDAGVVGCVTGFRRDVEAIYLCGRIPRRKVEWSSVLRSSIPCSGNPSSPAGQFGHPHAKPVDLMAKLIRIVQGTIVDPFMGSGSTLQAAKLLNRRCFGIEINERDCEIAARRLSQEVLALDA